MEKGRSSLFQKSFGNPDSFKAMLSLKMRPAFSWTKMVALICQTTGSIKELKRGRVGVRGGKDMWQLPCQKRYQKLPYDTFAYIPVTRTWSYSCITSKKAGKCSLASRQTKSNQTINYMGKWENNYWEKVYNHTFLFHCNGTMVSAGRAL